MADALLSHTHTDVALITHRQVTDIDKALLSITCVVTAHRERQVEGSNDSIVEHRLNSWNFFHVTLAKSQTLTVTRTRTHDADIHGD